MTECFDRGAREDRIFRTPTAVQGFSPYWSDRKHNFRMGTQVKPVVMSHLVLLFFCFFDLKKQSSWTWRACGPSAATKYVVNCAGMWVRQLAAKSEVSVPLQAADHYYLITDAMPEVDRKWPVEDPSFRSPVCFMIFWADS